MSSSTAAIAARVLRNARLRTVAVELSRGPFRRRDLKDAIDYGPHDINRALDRLVDIGVAEKTDPPQDQPDKNGTWWELTDLGESTVDLAVDSISGGRL
mgnify:CR=1 FL=1